MKERKRLSISPATAIALLALFFALGGSAFAVGERVQALTVAQQRCANGAVRGIAVVTGNSSAGIANVPDQFTAAGNLFSRKFNCTGRSVQVRRTAIGTFEVRFVGNAASSGVGTGIGDAYANVESLGSGTFRVRVHPAGRDDLADMGFTIVAV